jgi:hypothetical protein
MEFRYYYFYLPTGGRGSARENISFKPISNGPFAPATGRFILGLLVF